MDSSMKISTRSYCYLLFWFGLIALGSNLTPYFANDYRYFLVQGTQDFVSSFGDILVSQYRHYFEWGGRSVAHVIAQTLLWWGKPASAVAQALCYVTLILFIYYNAYGIKPTLRLRLMPIFIISLLLFMQLRAYGEVVFNIVSSANYLWTTTIVLIFLLPYRISMERDLETHILVLLPMMFILGVLAGWSNENTAAAVATGLGLYLLFNLRMHRLKLWQCVGYTGFLIGFALLIFAPGNQARLDSMEEKGFDALEHTISSVDIFFESLLACFVLVIMAVYLRFKVRSAMLQYSLPSLYHGSMWFIYTGFFALFLMIFSPNFPARSATPFTIFMIVGVIGLAKVALERFDNLLPPKISKALLILGTLFMVSAMINAIYCTIILNNDQKARDAEILSQIEAGKTHIVVSPMHAYTYKYVYVADVRANPDYWTNKILASFLGVESITRKCDYPNRAVSKDFMPYSGRYYDSECVIKVNQTPDVAKAQK